MKPLLTVFTLFLLAICTIWATFGLDTLLMALACFFFTIPLLVKAYFLWDDSREI